MFVDGQFDVFQNLFLQTLPDELMDIVLETEKCPVQLPGEADEKFEAALTRFNARNAKLFLCLTLTLQLSGKQQLLTSCSLKDGLAAWKFLVSISTACDMMTQASLVRRLKNFKQADHDLDDIGHRLALEALFAEAFRIGLLNREACNALEPLIYAESLPDSLKRVKELILLSAASSKLTVNGIFHTIVAHRKFVDPAQVAMPAFGSKSPGKAPKRKAGSSGSPQKKYPPVTDEERAGRCSICRKPGHGPRTCLRNPANNPESAHVASDSQLLVKYQSDSDSDSDSESKAPKQFRADTPAIALVAIVVDCPSASQTGKEFSSNNKGDGPTWIELRRIIATQLLVPIVRRWKTGHQWVSTPDPKQWTSLIEVFHVLNFVDPTGDSYSLYMHLLRNGLPQEFIESLPDGVLSEDFDGTLKFLWDRYERSLVEIHAPGHFLVSWYDRPEAPETVIQRLQSVVDLNQQLYGPNGRFADVTFSNLAQRRMALASIGRSGLALVREVSDMADFALSATSDMGAPNAYDQEIDCLKKIEDLLKLTRARLECNVAGAIVRSGSLVEFVLPRPSLPIREWEALLEEIHRRPLTRVRLNLDTECLREEFPVDQPIDRQVVEPEVVEPEVVDAPPRDVPPDQFAPPPTSGSEFRGDPMSDGPTSYSLPLTKAKLGRRPKVVKFYKFLVDSGCSRHMVNSSEVPLSDATPSQQRINGIDKDHPMFATEVGSVGLLQNVLGVTDLSHNLVSVGAACMRGYKFLFSKSGVTMFEETDMFFSCPLLEGKIINNLFYFDLSTEPRIRDDYTLHSIAMPATIVPENRAALWHARFGHIRTRTLKRLFNEDLVLNLSQPPTAQMWRDYRGVRCEACVKGKMLMSAVKRTPTCSVITTEVHKTHDNPYQKGQLVCMDLLTSSVLSIGNAKYALIIMDAGSHFIWTYFLKTKAAEEVRQALSKWLDTIRVDGLKPESFMTIRSDNGSEFIEAQNVSLLADNGIRHERSPPHHHVYLIERLNRTVQEMARSMLAHADLSPRYWAEAVMTAAYTLNRLPCKPYHEDKTRFEAYYGVKPDVSNLRSFGCHCWVREYDQNLKIWSSRGTRHRFVGYSLDSPLTWKVSDVQSGRTINSSNVIFDEGERQLGVGLPQDTDLDLLFQDNPDLEPTIYDAVDQVLVLPEDDNATKRKSHEIDELDLHAAKRPTLSSRTTRSKSLIPQTQRSSFESEKLTSSVANDALRSEVDSSNSLLVQDVVESLVAQYSTASSPSKLTPSEKLYRFQQLREQRVQAYAFIALERKVQFGHSVLTPLSERQARMSPHASEWIQGMLEEMQSLGENNTFELIEKPPGIMVLGHKWVYKVKTNEAGEITRFKCRYTALGNRQREFIDYDETFAPVVRSSSLKSLLAVAAARDLIVHQMDVDTAFLYGVMPPDPTLYMEVPDGYPIPDHLKGKENLVGIVKKGIYGLKQSPKLWNDTVNDYMISLGFTRFTTDPCMYKRGTEESCVFVAIYVDDLIIAGATMPAIDIFKDEMKTRFKMKDLGPIHYCLGMEVRQDLTEGTITLTQSGYVDSILRRFGLLDSNSFPIPMNSSLDLTLDGTEETFGATSEFDYPSAIGSLLYLSGCTRPDITFAVNRLSRSLNAHRPAHHKAARHVMRYLKGSPTIGLIYRRRAVLQLTGYSDADWAGETNGRRSVTGYLFTLGDSPISWNSKMQSTVAHSSTEAEYLAMGASAKEALYLERLLTELGVILEVHQISTKDLVDSNGVKLKLFGDNQGALAMTSSAKLNHKATKWYLVREHFIRDLVQSGALTVGYCDTDNMPADMMTKALALVPLRRHRDCTMTPAR
jgi:transposase InsO family protein